MRWSAVAAVMFVLGSGVAAGCRRSEPEAAAEQPVGVSVQAARRSSIRDAATASGLVVPSAAGDWTIYAPAAAQIARLPVKENDPVSAGDVLVQFEIASVTQELNVRQAAVAEATARADRAKAEFTRLSELFERGIASRNAYEAARNEQTTSASVLAQAVSTLEAAKLENSQATVRARIAGVVIESASCRRRIRQRLSDRSHSSGRRSIAPAGRGAVPDSPARSYRAGPGRDGSADRRRRADTRHRSRPNRRQSRPTRRQARSGSRSSAPRHSPRTRR